ncbi:MAG: hypothetical protein H7A38_02455 [Chlamydiales bacterium]|nr:hypothetical protein [Chlamydiales bacterium]
MKKLMFAFIALSFFSTTLVASEGYEKVYLEEEDIFFDQGKIFLQIEDGCLEVHTLASDPVGIYASLKEFKWPYTPFSCKKCNALNGPGARYCKKCGTRRPD